MKWPGHIILLFVLLCALVCQVVRLSQPPMEGEPDDMPRTAAPYPADMWQQLAHLPGVRFESCAADALPPGLSWQDGASEPPLGDARARKGGVLRLSSVGPFPANLLAFGSPFPQFFHTNAIERVELPLVQRHPVTREVIPGVAEAWAVQGKTVFFRLHAAARYSNGRPVRAGDYALGALLRARAGHDGAWDALCREVESICIYGDHALSVELRQERPLAALRAAALLHAAEPGFYAEFGSDYAERYAWRLPPTTGAYAVGRVERGRLVELRRVHDWWAANLPHYRHVCNVDSIEYHFLADEAQAWELFLHGRLDVMQTRHVAAWWQRLDAVPPERIVRRSYTLEGPVPPYGIAVNAKLAPDRELRRGLMQAMDMGRAVSMLFQGEAELLTTFTGGYGELTPRHTPVYRYDPIQARACFARAGYTESGQDGILRRADGRRLSLPLCYVPSVKVSALVSILAESAAACGVEIRPEPLPWQICAAKVRAGEHALTFWATAPAAPLPELARYFHSQAHGDEAPFGLCDAELDAALEACVSAHTFHELAAAIARVDFLVYDRAVWLPGWRENRVYLAHWPHVFFPEQAAGWYDAIDNHSFWIEEGGDS